MSLSRVLIAVALASVAPRVDAAIQLGLTSSPATGQPVGTTVLWIATASGASSFTYRFSLGLHGQPLTIVRDFSTRSVFDWTPIDEGTYDVKVVVRGTDTGETAELTATYVVGSRVTTGDPVVWGTPHPLVALYSVPPCASGSARVSFLPRGGTTPQLTPWKPCQAGKSVNFYVAGMTASTTFDMQHEISSESGSIMGPLVSFTTGPLPAGFPPIVVRDPADSTSSRAEGVLLESVLMNKTPTQRTFPLATDLDGRVLWYYDKTNLPWQVGAQLARPQTGGTIFMMMNDARAWQVLREIDLAGNTLRETNAARISEQLAALGQDPITSVHHDALRLPNGQIVVLGSVERILTDVQGPGPVDVQGDMVIGLDQDWQVVWAWNAFDRLDPSRAAVLGETCTGPTDGCRPLAQGSVANDWTHTNALAYSPADGNLLLSVRHQDWVVKIDYRDGAGTGEVVWRLGKGGDFTIDGPDPDPWFSHQHDPTVDGSSVVLYDNGNTRCAPSPATCQSRGQAYALDEVGRVATLVLNQPLGHYSPALGSAQRLANGNYHFLSGWVYPGPHSESIERLPDGTTSFNLATAVSYRSFRMKDLYTP